MKQQLLFPFVLDFYLTEVPRRKTDEYLHTEYMVKTQTPVSFQDFVCEKYRREPMGELRRFYENTLHRDDGVIVTWADYLR